MFDDTRDGSPTGSVVKSTDIELSDMQPPSLEPSESTMALGGADSQIEKGLIEHEGGSGGTGTGSIGRTCFNFINTIIGSGVIGLPFALNEAGMFLGLIELVLFAIMTDYSVNILIRTGNFVGSDDYQDICRKGFGRVRSCLFDIPLLTCLGWIHCRIYLFNRWCLRRHVVVFHHLG